VRNDVSRCFGLGGAISAQHPLALKRPCAYLPCTVQRQCTMHTITVCDWLISSVIRPVLIHKTNNYAVCTSANSLLISTYQNQPNCTTCFLIIVQLALFYGVIPLRSSRVSQNTTREEKLEQEYCRSDDFSVVQPTASRHRTVYSCSCASV